MFRKRKFIIDTAAVLNNQRDQSVQREIIARNELRERAYHACQTELHRTRLALVKSEESVQKLRVHFQALGIDVDTL